MNEHDEVTTLLPWYVNGTLDEREMARVTGHLLICKSCANEADVTLREARALHARALQGFDTFERGRERNFARLTVRLGRTRARRAPLVAFGVAATLLFAVGAGWWLRSEPAEPFRALTSPADTRHAVVQVIFDPTAPERDVRQVLRTSGGTLLGTPSAKGVYRVALAADMQPDAVTAQLREHSIVLWADVEQP